ncbi:protogenin B-like [Penaeus indicus]|uniref:protogenin B-like n=1 Tax=Penaeus indicus TaxID=29960 RepID=UPI00300D082A
MPYGAFLSMPYGNFRLCALTPFRANTEYGAGGSPVSAGVMYCVTLNYGSKLTPGYCWEPAAFSGISVVKRRGGVTDEGEYRCLVSTPVGVITGPPITLRVATMTKSFVLKPSNVSVVEGESVRLTCQIDSEPPATFTWTLDQQPLPQDDRYATFNSGVLHINGVQRTNAGIYRCLATNSVAGKERHSNGISVTVLERGEGDNYKLPSFLSPKDPVRVVQGENAIIECLATGVPLPTISWQRKLNESAGWEVLKMGVNGVSMIGQGTLVLSNVQNTSSGRYACTAKSYNSNTKREASVSRERELDVLTPPEVIDSPKPVNTLSAKTARLNCSVTGHPTPRVIWYKNGRPVVIKGRIVQSETNQLLFYNSITADKGMYQCLAINDAGYASSWALVVINSSKNQPEPPQNLNYVVLSSTSVLLTWDAVHPVNGELKAYSVHYVESEGSAMERQEVSLNTSLLLEGLKPNTNYTAFVRAYSNFPSEISESLVFRTAEDVPTDVPVVQLVPLSPTTLLVKWSPLAPEQARGTIHGYKILWRKRNHHYYHVQEVLADVHEFQITDLHPGKKYEVQVLAATKAGYPTKSGWPWIQQKMGEPTQDVPFPPEVTLKVLNDTSSDSAGRLAIKVDWEVSSENKVEIEGFWLKYKRQDQTWNEPITFPPTQKSYTITGLEADWYEVQVKAVSANGDGEPTVNVIHTRLPNQSTQFANTTSSIDRLEADSRSQTSVHLSWRVTEGQDGAAYYTIKYQQITHSPNPAEAKFARSETTEIVITGLVPFSTYEFSVRAHESEKTYGPFSHPVQAMTMGNLPSSPEDFMYEPTDASTIRLKWNPPEQLTGTLKKYEILYSLDKQKPLSEWDVHEVEGDATADTVGGLVSNTEYWFRIRGCSAVGCGESTEPLAATIPAILPPDQKAPSSEFYLILCLVTAFFLLTIIGVASMYAVKVRNISSSPRVLACNGNGHINGKRNTQVVKIGQADGQADGDCQEMEVYIPMLTQIPPDFKCTPLDTKGGYPETRMNGMNNPRCNGFVVRNRDHLQAVPHAETKGLSSEESERLVIGASSSNGAMSMSVLPQVYQNHSQEQREAEQGGSEPNHSQSGTLPPSPRHEHNHSGASQTGLANLTNLTTLSTTESDVEMEPEKMMADSVGSQDASTPYQHNSHHNTSATKTSSPQPPLTTVQ